MEAVRHNHQLRHRARQVVNAEDARRGEHGDAVEGAIPELAILLERLELFQKWPRILGRISFLERLRELFEQIAKANRVLLIIGVMPMRRLIKREAGRFRLVEEASGVIVKQ